MWFKVTLLERLNLATLAQRKQHPQCRLATLAQRNFDRWANVANSTLLQRCHIMLYSWHNVILRIRKLQRENLYKYYCHK